MRIKNEVKYNLIFILFLVCTATLLHFKSYDKLPTSVHVLQQSDHFALALGFLDNGFDFFHPTSFALNPEFSSRNSLTNPEGVTAVDFPILHYIAAVAMKMFDTRSPVVYRFISLLWSFVALWIFFKTIKSIKGFWMAIFLCGFIMFQPIYSYYQNGFHISSAAFNTFLIGCAYMIRHFHSKKNNAFIWGALFLTLASLMRFTQIIFLLALLSMYLYEFYQKRKLSKNLWVVLMGIVLVLMYFGYNQYLRFTYGSLFQSTPRIAESLNDFAEHILKIAYKYLLGFLPIIHLFALGLIIYLFLKREKKSTGNLEYIKIWTIFAFLGSLMFTLLMSFHISYHDYYALDTWFPVLILMMLYFLFSFKQEAIPSNQIAIFVILFLIGSFSVAFEKQKFKYSGSRKILNGNLVLEDFKKSAKFLDLNIPENEKVLVISNWGWNTPMIGWNRKVYRVANDFDENISLEFKRNYDIIVTHDVTLEKVVEVDYPEFYSKVQYVKGNGMVSLWKLNKSDLDQTMISTGK